jgi:ADP-heptose:LPS heptosyltransferase
MPPLSSASSRRRRTRSLAKSPFLAAAPERTDRWKQLAAWGGEGIASLAAKRLKIAIVWHANPKHYWDRHRSFPLDRFNSLARREDIQLYSFQTVASPERVAAFCRRFGMIDLGSRLDDFADTAAAVRNMDLVITCDSAPAHFARSLGKPVWVVIAAMSDWRWLLGQDDSPWYPTMRLFRQKRVGDWDEVFQRIELEVGQLLVERKAARADGTR